MAFPQPTPATSPERAGRRAIVPRCETWFLAYLFYGFAIPGLLTIQLPLVIVDAGHRPFRVGAVIACQNGGIVLAPLWGWMADRLLAWRAILIGSLALIGVSFAGLAVERSLTDLLMSGFLLGVGSGACSTMTILLVTKATPRDAWSGEIATLQMLGAMGSVLGFAVAGLVASTTGMLMAAGFSVLAVVAAARAPAAGATLPRAERASSAATNGRPRLGFAVFLVTWLLFSISVSEFASFYPITMARDFGVNVARSSAVLALATLASLALYRTVGRRTWRWGPVGTFAAGITGRAACLVMLAILPLAHGGASIIALGCAGLFQAIWPLIGVTSSVLSARLAPHQEGAAVGIFQAAGSVAAAIGALLSGYVADRYGYQDVLRVASAVAVASVFCSLALCRMVQAALSVSREPGG